MIRILLTSRFSMWMGWGRELIFFYNDAYQHGTLRAKHPWALGRAASEVWAEIWHDIGPRIDSVLQSGGATWDEGLLQFLERSGYPEETYHTFSYSPLSDEDGEIAGMLCVVTKDTDRVLSERRMATLRALASAVAATRTKSDVIDTAQSQLSRNREDLPFTLSYLFADDGTARLACTTGIQQGAPAAPGVIELGDQDGTWPTAQVRDGHPVVVDDLAGRFPQLPAAAWTQPPVQAAAVLLASAQGHGPATGFIVVGLNPYRPFDDRYRGFIELLANQIISGLVNAGSGRRLLRARQPAQRLGHERLRRQLTPPPAPTPPHGQQPRASSTSASPQPAPENPHIRFFNNRRGYVRTRITPGELRADCQVVPYVSRPDAAVQTKASFVVPTGSPRPAPGLTDVGSSSSTAAVGYR